MDRAGRRAGSVVSLAVLMVLAGASLPTVAGGNTGENPEATSRMKDRSAGRLRGLVRTQGVPTKAVGAHQPAGEAHRIPRPLMTPFSEEAVYEFRSHLRLGSGDRARGSRPTSVAPGPRAPASLGGFDAVANQNPLSSPGDPTGALGDSWYLTATNVRTNVYSPGGVEQFAPPIRLRTLAPSLPNGAFDFDPKVVYDHFDDQFVLVFLALDRPNNFDKSFIVIATVPDATADDPSTWCVTKINGDQERGDGKQWADYPALGYSSGRVTISTNQFDFDDSYAYPQLISIPKNDLYDCGSGLDGKVFNRRQTRNPNGSKAFTIQPAETYGAANRTQYLLSFQSRAVGGRKIVLWRIRKTSNGVKLANEAIPAGKARVAPLGTQAGGSETEPNTWWDVGDLRLVNAVYDAGTGLVYAAHAVSKNIGVGPYEEAAVRWYGVYPAGKLRNSSLERKGIIGTSDRDAGWPVVATDSLGNLFVTYSQAGVPGVGEYLSAYVARVTPADAVATQLLKAGEARYEFGPGPERWGDFNAINRDPNNPLRLAVVNQYAIDDGSCGGPAEQTCHWQQWVDLVEES